MVRVIFKDGTELIMSGKEFDRGMNRGIGWFEYNNKRYKLDLLKSWEYV